MGTSRIFISDLPETITQEEVEERFGKFGTVSQVEIKQRKSLGPRNSSLHFAYISLSADQKALQKCFEELNNKKWKGQYVQIQLAKESFLDRLKKERAESNHPVQKVTIEPIKVTSIKSELPKDVSTSEDDSDSDSDDSTPAQIENVAKVLKKSTDVEQKTSVLEQIEDVYSDMVVKNNKNRKLDNKIESMGNGLIVKTEIKKVKSKDPKRMEADQKRLKSILDMKKGYQQQKFAIQAALSRIDNKPKSKIIFDENDETSKLEENTKKVKQNLFDEESGDEVEGANEESYTIDIKKQFEGKKGQKLFELQSRYRNDERFQLDSRFADDGDEEVHENGYVDDAEMPELDEKQKQFEILEEVLGKKITHRASNTAEGSKQRTMLRFDPSQPEHSKYEVKEDAVPKPKKKKIKNEESTEQSEVPEVSKEQFYKVSGDFNTLLQEKEGFSLLNMFGRKNEEPSENIENEDNETEVVRKNGNLLVQDSNPFKYDSSSEDEAEDEKPPLSENKDEQPVLHRHVDLGQSRLWTESFFFKEDDYRLQEGADFILKVGTENSDDFRKMRRDLKEIVRAKVRNNQRKNRPFKKKLGGAGHKKMIRMKKALKR